MDSSDRTNIILAIGAACGFLRKVAQGHPPEEQDVERAREVSQALQNSIYLLGEEWYSVESTSSSVRRVLEV